MSQIFHHSTNVISRVSDLWRVILVAILGAVLYAIELSPFYTSVNVAPRTAGALQPQAPRGRIGIDCRYCHTTVEKSSFAGVPPTQTCMTCHSQIWTNSSMLEPVRASYRDDKSIAWTRVNALPEFVYFDHSIHVNKGVGCTTCHGPIAEMPLTVRRRHAVHVVVPRLPPAAGKVRAAEVGSFQSELRDAGQPDGTGRGAW